MQNETDNITNCLSEADKDAYFLALAPEHLAQFEGQTIGQLLYAQISELTNRQHPLETDKDLKSYMDEHAKIKDELLRVAVGEEYFPKYIADLEILRKQRQSEIMQQTEHLYHFSQKPPEQMSQLLPYHQETGNALQENIGISLCYADTKSETTYPLKPSTNKAEDYKGISVYMDEQCVLVCGKDFTEYVQSLQPSYRYEVSKNTFTPVVDLSGQFCSEYESSQPADIINCNGPFNIEDAYQNFKIPVFYIADEKDKNMLRSEYYTLMKKGMSRKNAMTTVCHQHPDKMKMLQEDKDLQQIVNNVIEKSDNSNIKIQNEEQTPITNEKIQEKLAAEKSASMVMIKRGLQNPKNQKFAEQIADKQIQKIGQGLTADDMMKIKVKIVSKGK